MAILPFIQHKNRVNGLRPFEPGYFFHSEVIFKRSGEQKGPFATGIFQVTQKITFRINHHQIALRTEGLLIRFQTAIKGVELTILVVGICIGFRGNLVSLTPNTLSIPNASAVMMVCCRSASARMPSASSFLFERWSWAIFHGLFILRYTSLLTSVGKSMAFTLISKTSIPNSSRVNWSMMRVIACISSSCSRKSLRAWCAHQTGHVIHYQFGKTSGK